jgi:hypothetical protein
MLLGFGAPRGSEICEVGEMRARGVEAGKGREGGVGNWRGRGARRCVPDCRRTEGERKEGLTRRRLALPPPARQRLNLFSFPRFSSLPCDGAIGALDHSAARRTAGES